MDSSSTVREKIPLGFRSTEQVRVRRRGPTSANLALPCLSWRGVSSVERECVIFDKLIREIGLVQREVSIE